MLDLLQRMSISGLVLVGLSALAAESRAASGGMIPVGEPIEAELRILEVWPAAGDTSLPHLSTLPLQRGEAAAVERAAARRGSAERSPRTLALRRVGRELARDAVEGSSQGGTTARWFDRRSDDGSRLEASVGLVGAASFLRESSRWHEPSWMDGSGLRTRLTASIGPWVAHTDLAAGHLSDVRTFSDALIEGRDIALSTDDSYLALAPGTAWQARVGRTRAHWGPGEEASLLLSRTAPSLSGFALGGRLASLRSHLSVLHATTDPGRSEQLAAHRIEWQPKPGLRIGVAEAARYRSSGWQAGYLASVIPFSLVQRMLDQDSGGSDDSVRNNVLLSVDAAWRVADGTRLYGELLVDDLHARSRAFSDKWGYQLGLDGAGPWGKMRLSWNTEYTRLSRYVYTSYYGRRHTARGEPLGHPIGPDASRLRVRITCDSDDAWQLSAIVSQTDRGEGRLDEAFVPGSPVQDPMDFEGVVERNRRIEGELRWWPATGIDASLRLGAERTRDADHIAGNTRHGLVARVALALWR